MKNWEMILYLLTPFTIGGTAAIHFSEISKWWMTAIGFIDIFVYFLRYFAVDKDNNGIIDRFEKDKNDL